MVDVHADPRHPVHAMRRSVASTLLEQHDFGPGISIPIIPTLPWNDERPDRLQCRIEFEGPGGRRLPCLFEVVFVEQTSTIAAVECQRLADGAPFGVNPYADGRRFLMRSGPLVNEVSWSWLLRSLHTAAAANIVPFDEVGTEALALLDAFGDAYSNALDEKLPGQPFANAVHQTMLHEGPDTPLGRALFILVHRAQDRTGFLQRAVATLWVGHGRDIEQNCDIEALLQPQPSP